MMPVDFRYQSGSASGFQQRLGQPARGNELRHIPGTVEEEEIIRTPVEHLRFIEFDSQFGSGQEWTIWPGDYPFEHNITFDYTVPDNDGGDATIAMQTTQLVASEGEIHPQLWDGRVSDAVWRQEWDWDARFLEPARNMSAPVLYPDFRTFVYANSPRSGSHITQTPITSIDVLTNHSAHAQVGSTDPGDQSRLTLKAVTPLINGVVVADRVVVDRTHQSFVSRSRVEVPITSTDPLTLNAGDVLGINCEWDAFASWTTGKSGETIRFEIRLFNYLVRYNAGHGNDTFRPSKHTYELDFGDTTKWTPDGNAVWTFEDSSLWTFSGSSERGCFARPKIGATPTEPHAGFETEQGIELTWDGERVMLSFNRVIDQDNVTWVAFAPRDDGSNLPVQAHSNSGLIVPQCGQWDPVNATVFDVVSVARGNLGAGRTYVNSANIADSITVRRVDQ